MLLLFFNNEQQSNPSSGCTLFMHGCAPLDSGCTLYTYASESLNSFGLNLFIKHNFYESSGNIPLYTKGLSTPSSGNITLFEQGHDILDSGCDLYIKGIIDLSSDPFNLFLQNTHFWLESGCPLYQPGHDILDSNQFNLFINSNFTPLSGNIPLFLQQGLTNSGNIPLYTFGHGELSSGTPLYIKSTIEINSSGFPLFLNNTQVIFNLSGNIPLFVSGIGTSENNIPLYINSNQPSGNIPLYQLGHIASSGYLNLHIQGSFTYSSNSIDLFLFATNSGTHGLYKGIDLFLYNDNIESGGLNLFLQGSTRHSVSGLMNLFLAGTYTSIGNGLSLFLYNEFIGSGLPLYIKGSGFNIWSVEGSLPLNSWMNLYLERATANACTLYMKVPGTLSSGNIPLYQLGHAELSSGVPLSIPDITGILEKSLKLFTRGF